MKKILSSVIIISMCLALVSCSGSTGNSSGEDIEIAKPDCADISTETYEDNALTMTVPSGWTVDGTDSIRRQQAGDTVPICLRLLWF